MKRAGSHHVSAHIKDVSLHVLMDQSRVDLDGRVRRVVVLVGNGLRRQSLDVQALSRLQQGRQLRMIHADLSAVDKFQESFQVARRNAGQHHNRMLACCVLRKRRMRKSL